jgi:hypothetical protein
MTLQLACDRVSLHSQVECVLEKMRVNLSVVVADASMKGFRRTQSAKSIEKRWQQLHRWSCGRIVEYSEVTSR